MRISPIASFSSYAASASLLGGVLVLTGWSLDHQLLKSLLRTGVSMNPLTAVLFMLLGTALWLVKGRGSSSSNQSLPAALSAAIITIGCIWLGSYLGAWSIGIDQILFQQAVIAEHNVMAPNTALGFVQLGLSVFLLARGARVPAGLFAIPALAVMLLALFALIGYSYQNTLLYRVGSSIPMAVNTALLFLVLSAGILCVRPNDTFMTVIMSKTAGGMVFRYFLPLALFIPWIAGWLTLKAQMHGEVDPAMGLSLLVLGVIVSLMIVISWTAMLLHRTDSKRQYAEVTLQRAHDGLERRVRERTAALAVANEELEKEIEERKRTERALRASEAQFHAFMNHSPAMAFLKDDQGRYVYANKPYERQFQMQPGEWYGKTDGELWPAKVAHQTTDHDHTVLESGRPMELEVSVPVPEKGQRNWMVWKFPLQDADAQRMLGSLAIDITERKELEQQLRQAQKMEAIGQLAGGIAHDFNNLLTVINGYSQMLLTHLPEGDRMALNVTEIFHAGERAARLTKQLLAFSRSQVLEVTIVNLNTIVTSVETLLVRLIREDIRLVSHLAAELPGIKADAGQLEQVLMNLIVNARDAMPKGGSITVETANVDLRGPIAGGHGAMPPGVYAMLAVSDTGCGMDFDTQSRIFDPFFTTKEPGQGTGLGLATVYGIVKQSKGHISVYSEVGHGTTFKLLFPHAEEANSPATLAGSTSVPGIGRETILLVEDDDQVRRVVGMMLQSRGYTVLEAVHGQAALELVRKTPEHIDLLITDMIMPIMSGADLADHLTHLNTTLNVLFFSGYTERVMMKQGCQNRWAYLQKPITVDTLARKVREILDAGAKLPLGQI